MRKIVIVSVLLALTLALFATPTYAMTSSSQMWGRNRFFWTYLSGRLWVSRVDPNVTYGPIKTWAQGLIILQVSGNSQEIRFILIVANIKNVTMAHIHLDDGSPVGPIVVWLYPRMPPPQEIPGRFSGILARGTISSDNLVGPLQGQPLSSLVEKLMEGNAYVVVHTTQHPPGEIRGWIR